MSQNTILSLCNAYKDYFPIGAAITVQDLQGVQGELLKKHFNSLTAENAMKPAEIHPEEERYDFEKTDKMKDFALANNMKMRGHTFVWHNQTPEWFFVDKNGNPASRDLLLGRLKEHINALTSRYKGLVYSWDVVNEAIEDKSGAHLRDTKWLRLLGEDYIKTAFELAREADSSAALVYNDYNNESPDKLAKTIKMLKDIMAKGAPVDTVGIQAHWSIRDNNLIDNLKKAIEAYAALGLKIQVTELDVSMYSFMDRRTDLLAPKEEMLQVQAEVYNDIFSVFREYRDVVTSVTFWGISDMYTWKDNFPVRGRKDWPMLFDVNGQPKASLKRVTEF